MRCLRNAAAVLLGTVLVFQAQRLCAEQTTSSARIRTYCNPFPMHVADPFALKSGGKYYLYGTTHTDKGFEVFTSDDLTTWANRGYCYRKSDGAWGDKDFWAPEVIEKDCKFFLIYAVKNVAAKYRNICVAEANSPLGPFRDIKAPLLPGRSYIDPTIFHDPVSGDHFLYVTEEDHSPNQILMARLSPSLVELQTSLTTCLRPSQKWEKNGWIEAPCVLKHGDWYYLLYSGNAFYEPEYSIGYAVSRSPLGPFEKFSGNPVLHKTDTVIGPGHCGVVESPDRSRLYMVYHILQLGKRKSRLLAIDPIQFKTSGNGGADELTMPGAPTDTPQPF